MVLLIVQYCGTQKYFKVFQFVGSSLLTEFQTVSLDTQIQYTYNDC